MITIDKNLFRRTCDLLSTEETDFSVLNQVCFLLKSGYFKIERRFRLEA